jgi:hypothetical protein
LKPGGVEERQILTQFHDFDLRALYEALDAQRKARGISWAEAAREMNGKSGPENEQRTRRSSGHVLSASTVKGIGTRRVAECDGVLAMLRWLNRTPESFMPGHPALNGEGTRWPEAPAGKGLRFDTKKLYAALDAQRAERRMTWAQVAKDLRVSASMLTHLAKGGRTGFPHVMRYVDWLGRPVAEFMRASDW